NTTQQTSGGGGGTAALDWTITPTSGKITGGKTNWIHVTSATGTPQGSLIIFGGSIQNISISSGYASYSAPTDMICPVSITAHDMAGNNQLYLFDTPICVPYVSPDTGSSSVEFIPSAIEKNFEQDITNQLTANIHNSGSNDLKLVSGTFSATTYSTAYGEQPIRLSGTAFANTQLPTGQILPISFSIDTRGMPAGTYSTIFTLVCTDTKGKTLLQSFPATITVVQKSVPTNSTTQLIIAKSKEYPIKSDTIYLEVFGGGANIPNANLKITFNGVQSDYYTPTNGKILYYVPDNGDYTVVAHKDGYVDGIMNFTVGTKQIVMTTSTPQINTNLQLNVTYNGNPLDGATIQITAPDNTLNTYTTSTQGILNYVLNQLGTYYITASKDNYQSATINVSSVERPLVFAIVGDPTYTTTITVRAKEGDTYLTTPALVSDPDNIQTTQQTDFSLTLSKTGTYTITAQKTGYAKTVYQLNVSQAAPTINVTGDQLPNSNLVVEVFSGTTGLSGATVTITKPDGKIDTYQTNNGKVQFTTEGTGSYTIQATKTGYQTSTANIVITSRPMTLKIGYTNANSAPIDGPKLNARMVLTAETTTGTVTTPIIPTYKITGPDGAVYATPQITLNKEGTYSIEATLNGYVTATNTVIVPGRTATLLTPPQDINVGGTVTMQFDKPIEAVQILCGANAGTTLATDTNNEVKQKITVPGDCRVLVDETQIATFKVNSGMGTEEFMQIVGGIILVIAIIGIGAFGYTKLRNPSAKTDQYANEAVGK
ncbi:MAG: carboxypeptidase-like regulatory domain-containing protein, partial [Candidatus Bathyarchaeia archaeon]